MQQMKHTRYRTDGKRRVLQAFLAPPPERVKANPFYRCPAGPGRRPVPSEGRWYDVTSYRLRRFLQGDLVNPAPPKDTAKAAK